MGLKAILLFFGIPVVLTFVIPTSVCDHGLYCGSGNPDVAIGYLGGQLFTISTVCFVVYSLIKRNQEKKKSTTP